MRFRDVWFVPFSVALGSFICDLAFLDKTTIVSAFSALDWLAGGLATLTVIHTFPLIKADK